MRLRIKTHIADKDDFIKSLIKNGYGIVDGEYLVSSEHINHENKGKCSFLSGDNISYFNENGEWVTEKWIKDSNYTGNRYIPISYTASL